MVKVTQKLIWCLHRQNLRMKTFNTSTVHLYEFRQDCASNILLVRHDSSDKKNILKIKKIYIYIYKKERENGICRGGQVDLRLVSVKKSKI